MTLRKHERVEKCSCDRFLVICQHSPKRRLHWNKATVDCTREHIRRKMAVVKRLARAVDLVSASSFVMR